MLPIAYWSHISRSAYYALHTIFKDTSVASIHKNDLTPLANALSDLSIDHQQGVIQHKTSIVSSILSQKFPLSSMYNSLKNKVNSKIDLGTNPLVDSRVMSELPLAEELLGRYDDDINKILVTGDTLQGDFPYQKQTNQDFWVSVFPKGSTIDRILGLTPIVRPHDVKSGMDMFRHSTRGSLGLLTFTENSEHSIQTMNKEISVSKLLQEFDSMHLNMLSQALKTDGLFPKYQKLLISLENDIIAGSSLDSHNKYQQVLWDHIQLDPEFKRTISFIFAKRITYTPLSERAQAFHDSFISKLNTTKPNKVYDLNKISDRREIFNAMLLAFRETTDSKILQKIKYLEQHIQLGFTREFLNITNQLYKEYVGTTL